MLPFISNINSDPDVMIVEVSDVGVDSEDRGVGTDGIREKFIIFTSTL